MRLTENITDTIIAAAREVAQYIGVPMTIAVFDASAHLKAFTRMDGALLGSTDIALGKAKTSALFGMSTDAVGEFCKPGGTSPGLEMTNGTLVVFAGGVPLRDANGTMIGAVGVSGGTVDQDFQVASAAAGAAQNLGIKEERKMTTVTEEADRNRTLVQRSFEHWRDGTGSPFEILADDAEWTITGNSLVAQTYRSRESFLSEVIRPFNARMRDRLIPTIREFYADGDAVIVRFDAHGMAHDGKPYVNSYAWFMQLRNGRIVKAEAFFDSTAFDDFWRRVAPREKSRTHEEDHGAKC